MEKRTISDGVYKLREYKNSIFLGASCDCIDSRHSQMMIMEYDDEIGKATLTIYMPIYASVWERYADSWYEKVLNFFRNWRKRLSMCYDIIFKGYLEHEGDFIFKGEDQIKDYISALEQALEKINAR